MKTAFIERSSLESGILRDERTHVWAARCGTAGAAVWAGIAVLARLGVARIGAIELMFLFAPLVIVPLGLELGREMVPGGWLGDLGRRVQPLGAGMAVVAMLLPPGKLAGAVAVGWMSVCLLVAGAGLRGRVSGLWGDADIACPELVEGSVRATRVLVGIAGIDLVVGGAWLVASRLGMRPMGMQEPIGLLTAVHFHFAGFATAMIAAATLRFAERRGKQRWLRRLVFLVVGMPFVVAAGFVISPGLKMVAGLLFAASVAGLAIFVHWYGRRAEDRMARVLLQVAAGAVFAGMVLAGMYAVADLVGSEVLTIPQMARTHGVLNAVGFCLPGLLGWLSEGRG